MKILLIPLDFHKHSDDRMFGDMLRAFGKNNEAQMFENIQSAVHFAPDVIFYQGGLTSIDCQILKAHTDSYWVTWTGDVRYAPMEHLMNCRSFTDLFLLPFTGKLLKTYYKLLGVPCRFIFEPFQNWKFIAPKEMQSGRITFVGNIYDTVPGGEQRKEIIPFLSKHFNEVQAYGSGFNEPMDNFKVPELYNNSFAVICDNNWKDIPGYFTPRNLNAMSAGSCALMRIFPDIEKQFENWEHCIYYRHKYELLDIISFLKQNPEQRNRIAKSGYEHARKNFTFDNFVTNFINTI